MLVPRGNILMKRMLLWIMLKKKKQLKQKNNKGSPKEKGKENIILDSSKSKITRENI